VRNAAGDGPDDGEAAPASTVESVSRASFLSTSTQATRGQASGALNVPQGAQSSAATPDAAAARPADPRAAGRESAMQLMEMQAKMAREMQAAQGGGKPSASALPVDGNSAWLYAAQSREATENKPLQAQVTLGRYVIFAGTAIQAVLTQALDTKLPGQITARVSRDVYDSRYGRFLVVPRGSILTGSYRSAITDGQSRVLMAFDRLITPAGRSVPLGNMSASDVLGVGGVPGELHTHFFQRLGIATLLAIETAVMEKSVGQVGTVQGNGQNGQATSSASGQIMLQTANQELQRQYAVTPNITLEPAAVITIISTADIEIAPLANTR
jgi:type IV secretory pathway VirB10-like protein